MVFCMRIENEVGTNMKMKRKFAARVLRVERREKLEPPAAARLHSASSAGGCADKGASLQQRRRALLIVCDPTPATERRPGLS